MLFDCAPHFGVREHVKFIITNSGHDSSRHFRRVHATSHASLWSSVGMPRPVVVLLFLFTLINFADKAVIGDRSRSDHARTEAF